MTGLESARLLGQACCSRGKSFADCRAFLTPTCLSCHNCTGESKQGIPASLHNISAKVQAIDWESSAHHCLSYLTPQGYITSGSGLLCVVQVDRIPAGQPSLLSCFELGKRCDVGLGSSHVYQGTAKGVCTAWSSLTHQHMVSTV